MITGKSVLITGGAGFIGSNLAKCLNASNKIIVVDDLSEGHAENLAGLNNVEFVKEDVRNEEFIQKLFTQKKFDYVFHLAASFANQKSIEFPTQDLEINGFATLKLLEAAQKNGLKRGLKRFVYASSSCVYGPVEERMREEMKPAPETPYAITKLLGEYYANFFFEYYKLPTVIVRYFNVYGPNEYPGKYRNVIPNFFARALARQPLPVMGDGRDSRDFTFVEDAVEGTLLAAEKQEAVGQTFNIGCGVETRIIDLAKTINKITGNDDKIRFVPKRAWDKISRRVADVSKAKKLLDFKAKTPLEQGLRKTFEWFKTIPKERL